MTKFKSQGLHIIRIKYWNASGSGSPPFFIPAHWNIGILNYKQDQLRKHMQHIVSTPKPNSANPQQYILPFQSYVVQAKAKSNKAR